MSDSAPQSATKHEEFSLRLFTFTVLATLAGLLIILRWAAPGVWIDQFIAPAWALLVAFLGVSLINAFFEYFFHRYLLHTPVIPIVSRLYRQHTLHHSLTRIARKSTRDGRGLLFIENKFPIIEPEQGEASFFPWYSLAIFSLLLTPLLALLQWALPAFPWFLGGFAALAVSMTLYEVLHAINHWPMEKWEPLILSPRWGWFWQPVYAFHLRHHAVIDCNESISGFFGLPVSDWVFRTCIIPQTLYAEGEEWTMEKFKSPRPVGMIRVLDTWAAKAVQRRRALAAGQSGRTAPTATEAPTVTRGERIALWATHGLGLALSLTALILLIVYSVTRGNVWHIASFSVFGATLLLLYATLTRFHLRRDGRPQQTGRRLDHAAIFLVVAGTFTPFLLTNMRGPWGWTLFAIVWAVCGVAAIIQLRSGGRLSLTATIAWLVGGALAAVVLKPLLATLPLGGVWLLLGGGLSYTLALVVFRWSRVRYQHVVWNTFMLGGSACHLLAMLLFLLPGRAV